MQLGMFSELSREQAQQREAITLLVSLYQPNLARLA